MDLKRQRRKPNGGVYTQELPHTRRFKYTYQGNTFYLTLPKKGTIPDVKEKQIAKLIEIDMIGGTLNATQLSYKKMLVLAQVSDNVSPPVTPPRAEHLVLHQELKNYFYKSGRDITKDFYNACHVMVKNWGDNTGIDEIPEKLVSMRYAAKTFNNPKSILNAFCDWMVRAGMIKFNPVHDVPSKKMNTVKKNTRLRMTDNEITDILEAIRTDRFCQPIKLIFIHIFHAKLSPISTDKENFKYIELETRRFKNKLYLYILSLYTTLGIKPGKYSSVVRQGISADLSILDYCRENEHINYISISTRRAGNVNKIFRTNTGNLITKSDIPVLVIPKKYRHRKLKSLLYTSDLLNSDTEIREVLCFARPPKINVKILHLLLPEEASSDKKHWKLY